jgi:hypothetical protein
MLARGLARAALTAGLFVPLLGAGAFRDSLWNADHLETIADLEFARVYPPVPTRPQIRLSPENLNYGLPEIVGRQHREAMEQLKSKLPGRMDLDSPGALITTWTTGAPYLRKPYFPELLRLEDGTLLAFYSEGQGHGNFRPVGRGVMVRSTDGGRHWTPPLPVPNEEQSGQLGFGSSALQTRDGMIWLTANRGHNRFLLRSSDSGQTWKLIPFDDERVAFLDPVTELSDGEFFWMGYSMQPAQASDVYRDGKTPMVTSAVLRAAEGDDPRRWDWDVRLHRDFPVGLWDELSGVETRTPGHLVVLVRLDSLSTEYLQTESDDYGRHWTGLRRSGIWMSYDCSRPHLIKLPEGALVCAHDERSLSRSGINVSFDDGRTWDPGDRILALDSPAYLAGDFAYPRVAWLGGSRVLQIMYNAFNTDPAKIGLWGAELDIGLLRHARRGLRLPRIPAASDSGTVGQWSFDEPDGDVIYEARNREHGFLFGASRVPGYLGGALRFDGQGGYAAIADHPAIQVSNTFTVEAWINTSDAAREQAIVAKRPRYYVGLEDSKIVFAYEGKPHVRGTRPLDANRWHHVAVMYKPSPDSTWMPRVCIFVDGVLDTCGKQQFQLTRTIDDYARYMARNDAHVSAGPEFRGVTTLQTGPLSTERIHIGIDSDSRSRNFSGIIDEVAVHDGAIADAEIAAHARTRYRASGEVVSLPVELPEGCQWDRFNADFRAPEGTRVRFDLLGDRQAPLLEDIRPGALPASLKQRSVRLRATLTSSDGHQTPTLLSWEISWK